MMLHVRHYESNIDMQTNISINTISNTSMISIHGEYASEYRYEYKYDYEYDY